MVEIISNIFVDIFKYSMWEGMLLLFFLSRFENIKIPRYNYIIFGFTYGMIANLNMTIFPPIIFQCATMMFCGFIFAITSQKNIIRSVICIYVAFSIMLNVNILCGVVFMKIFDINVSHNINCLLIVQYVSYILTLIIYKLLFKLYKGVMTR